MIFSLRNHSLVLVVLACIMAPGISFAQNPPGDRVGLSREELKLEMKPVLKTDDRLAGGRQELKLLPKAVLPQRTSITSDKTDTKKVFTTETGLVDVASMPSGVSTKLTLDDCVKIAIKNHIPLQIAQKSVTLARWRLWENRRNMLPTATIVFEEYGGEVQARRYVGRKQYIEGQQPVFHGGELYYTMKQAETNMEVVRNDYDRIKNDLVLQVKKAYYSFERAAANLSIQQALAVDSARILDMINRQLEANVTTKIEFLNVSSQAGQVKYQLTSAEGDVSMAELILKQAMNLDSGDRIEIEPSPEFKKADVDYSRLLRIALLNRPEMKINSLLIDYYNYGKKIAEAKGWIKVDLVGQWGLADEHFRPQDLNPLNNDALTKLSQQWYGGVKASMPFWGSTAEYQWTKEQWTQVVSAFQGTEATTNSYKFKILDKLDYFSDKETAGIEFDKQRQEMNKIKQDVTMEVKEGCFNYAKAIIQLDTASNKVQYQEKDLEFVKLKRGMDEAQDSNVVESMIKLAQEKFGYLQALADCRISLASIDKAIGIEDYFNPVKKGRNEISVPAKDLAPKPIKKKASFLWFTTEKKVKNEKIEKPKNAKAIDKKII